MERFRTALLAAAFTAGLPAMAMAQAAPDRHDHGDHGYAGHEGGRPEGVGRAGPGGPTPGPQARPQPAPQPGPQVRPQDYHGAPENHGFGGGRPGWQGRDNDHAGWQGRQNGWQGHDEGRRDEGARGYGRPDDHRYQGDRRFEGRVDVYRGGGDRFDRGWRNDRRYDWRGWRENHRDMFRMPRYVAPRGWGYGYRRFGIGARLPAFFYGQSYWIDDPYDYRLPPAYGPYRWIRYYDDALLIDLRTGLIVDEIPDFFW